MFEAIAAFLELLIRPQITLYEAFLAMGPWTTPTLNILLGLALVSAYAATFIMFLEDGSFMGVIEQGPFFLAMLIFVGVIGLCGFIANFLHLVPKMVSALSNVFFFGGFMIAQAVTIRGAFGVGTWGGRYPALFLIAFIVSLLLTLVINTLSLAIFISAILVILTAIEALRGAYQMAEDRDLALSIPFILIAVLILTLLGGAFQERAIDGYLPEVQTDSAIEELVSTLLRGTTAVVVIVLLRGFPFGLLAGFLWGLIHFVGHLINQRPESFKEVLVPYDLEEFL